MKVFITLLVIFKSTALISASSLNAKSLPKVVGGIEANVGEFPSIVIIYFGPNFCAGSIISAEWIMTAAHCAVFPLNEYKVTAGEHNVKNHEGNEQIRIVSEIVVHPNYDENFPFHDIALLRVDIPFTLTTFVAITPLAPKGMNLPPGSQLTTAGWGSTSLETPTQSATLMKVDVPLVDINACNITFDGWIDSGNICAGGEEGKDACLGDSGGPLYTATGTIVGTVSWSTGCGEPGVPGVYVDVSYYAHWIAGTITVKQAFPCRDKGEGYFEIPSTDKARYCPSKTTCDFVLCSFIIDVYVRVFYVCAGDAGDVMKDDYRFDEISQTCVLRV